MNKICFENVSFGYKRDKKILSNISFEIECFKDSGYVVALMGGSGSGKSTILKLILGTEKNYAGKIILPQNKTISYVPQEPILFEQLSLIDNTKYFQSIKAYKDKFNLEIYDEVLDILQIKDILKSQKSISEISGGQKQRISLLRALSIEPDILILDEPLTGLDEEIKEDFLHTLGLLIKKLKIIVIYVTHHRREVEFISDEILYLNKNNGVANKLIKTETNIFFKNTPTIDSLLAIKEMTTNIISCQLSKENEITLVRLNSNDNIYKISFNEQTVKFSNKFGFQYKIHLKTGVYIVLYLDDFKEKITISLKHFDSFIDNEYIDFSGAVDMYDNSGLFMKQVIVDENRINYEN